MQMLMRMRVEDENKLKKEVKSVHYLIIVENRKLKSEQSEAHRREY